MAKDTTIRKFMKDHDMSYLPATCVDILDVFLDWVKANSYLPNSKEYQSKMFETAMKMGIEMGRIEKAPGLPGIGKPKKFTVDGVEGWYELVRIDEADIIKQGDLIDEA